MKWLGVFLAMWATDYLYAAWSASVTDKRPVWASIYAVGIIFCGAFAITTYVNDPWAVIPAAVGGALGTYMAVRQTCRD